MAGEEERRVEAAKKQAAADRKRELDRREAMKKAQKEAEGKHYPPLVG